MEVFVGAIAAAAGTLAFFGGIALCMWVDQRGKWRQRELESAERIKALEHGQTLPDAEIARAEAEKSRARAAGTIGVLVPLFTLAASVGTTAVVLEFQRHRDNPFIPGSGSSPAVITIWVVCGVIVTSTAIMSLRSLRRAPVAEPQPAETARPVPPTEKPREPILAEFAAGSAAFKERT